MKKKKSCLYLLALLFLLAAVPQLHAEVIATTSLNVKSFPVDRVAQLSVTVQGQRAFSISTPVVEGLLFHHRGQSSRMKFGNGTYFSSATSIFIVEANREGSFTIPPITIESKEGPVVTTPITFVVTAATTNANVQPTSQGGGATTRLRSGDSTEVAFLRVIPRKTESYSGEIVPIEIKVYFREGIQANWNSMPQLKGEGFVLQPLQREPFRSREVVGNSRYSVLTWVSALSGIKEGKHTLSMEIDATLLLRQQQRTQRSRGAFADPFLDDSFFNRFFGAYLEKEVKVASPKLEMTVESLPEIGKPDTFTGAIGNFRLQVKADPLEISKGDPVTLTMTVSGEGNFGRVQAPQLQKQKGWKSYTPSSEFLQDSYENRGKKVFEQALVAKSSRLTEIPAVAFSYFDPESGTYKELISASIPLTMQEIDVAEQQDPVVEKLVNPTTEEAVQITPKKVEQPVPGLAPLQLDAGQMNKQLEPLFTKQWFQVFCAVLLFAICVAIFITIRNVRFAGNPILQRKKSMKQLLEKREQEIEEHLQAKDSRGFLASSRSAIQEQLGLLWNMEAAAITLIDLQKRLPQDSVLCAIFSAAEDSAYSGQELSQQHMQEFATSLKKELTNL
jgi:BatD DUF11 like domain